MRNDLGVMGTKIVDPYDDERVWTVQCLYAPVSGRALGGVRAKLLDNKGFTSFCNQRDLEVLLELGTPGRYCRWAGQEYVEPGDREWYGLCADTEDLLDDLYEREMLLREAEGTGFLPPRSEIIRLIHAGDKNDAEELLILLWDMDPETGMCPDVRLSTIERRWTRVQREKVVWDRC